MKLIIKLEKPDIVTVPVGLNFMIQGTPVDIILSRTAAEELYADLARYLSPEPITEVTTNERKPENRES